jgi:peptide/nickel transport system ATP-binding protein/oligopeptide transport system ATP-binding protein
MTALLSTEGLAKHFAARIRWNAFGGAKSGVRAVDDLSMEIAPSETLALVGESGCGKSTTGRLIMRLIEPSAGRVVFEGKDITTASDSELRRARRRMQMVFQDPRSSLSPRRTILQTVAEPLDANGLIRSPAHRRAVVAELLDSVGLSASVMARYPHQFSGGQRQRVGIARAIALGPSLIVADEPVSALDVSVQAQIINLMQDLKKARQLSYLFISHDLAVVRHIADRVAVMYLGRIVEIGPKEEVFRAPHHPYTQALLSAAPEARPNARRSQRRIVLSGDVPSPSAIPSGCSFRTRCPMAQEICARERPLLGAVAPGHSAACHFAQPNPLGRSS